MRKPHKAVERLSLDQVIGRLPASEAHARVLLARLNLITPVRPGILLLDVGSAQGCFIVACARRGIRAFGIEPWDNARCIASELAQHEGVAITTLAGIAEAIPFANGCFDVVHAMSVIEHVRDAQSAFNEACRVLKPGGVFWFYTMSSLCPHQPEISGFPCFGWYPDRLKRRIMEWARKHRPHLVGDTETPAINWFTPWKARRMLREAGFRRVYDRWDMPRLETEGRFRRAIFGLIRSSCVTKFLADVAVPGCAYAAVK